MGICCSTSSEDKAHRSARALCFIGGSRTYSDKTKLHDAKEQARVHKLAARFLRFHDVNVVCRWNDQSEDGMAQLPLQLALSNSNANLVAEFLAAGANPALCNSALVDKPPRRHLLSFNGSAGMTGHDPVGCMEALLRFDSVLDFVGTVAAPSGLDNLIVTNSAAQGRRDQVTCVALLLRTKRFMTVSLREYLDRAWQNLKETLGRASGSVDELQKSFFKDGQADVFLVYWLLCTACCEDITLTCMETEVVGVKDLPSAEWLQSRETSAQIHRCVIQAIGRDVVPHQETQLRGQLADFVNGNKESTFDWYMKGGNEK